MNASPEWFPDMLEDVVLNAMREAGWTEAQIKVMTYAAWKDGIDIERPSTALMTFVLLVRKL
jgi:hypothetical protein